MKWMLFLQHSRWLTFKLKATSLLNQGNSIYILVSQALGIARHKVNVKVKRIGGGFGGKEFAPGLFAAAAASFKQFDQVVITSLISGCWSNKVISKRSFACIPEF